MYPPSSFRAFPAVFCVLIWLKSNTSMIKATIYLAYRWADFENTDLKQNISKITQRLLLNTGCDLICVFCSLFKVERLYSWSKLKRQIYSHLLLLFRYILMTQEKIQELVIGVPLFLFPCWIINHITLNQSGNLSGAKKFLLQKLIKTEHYVFGALWT